MAKDRVIKDPHGVERPSWKALLGQMAVRACVIFTASCIIALAIGTAVGEEGMGYGWSLLAASAVGAVLQALFFTGIVFPSMANPVRMLLFGLGFYGLLAWIAATFRWFPVDRLGSWLIFTAFYLGGLGVGCVIWALRGRSEERRLSEHLDRYRKEGRS